jgi:hypothetical protein
MYVSFLVFAAAIVMNPEPLAASGCSSATAHVDLNPPDGCGCEGWVTYNWGGTFDCAGSYQEDIQCADQYCHHVCDEELVGHNECDSNQWSSWIGFRCGDNCS